jgi:hypothetical protein
MKFSHHGEPAGPLHFIFKRIISRVQHMRASRILLLSLSLAALAACDNANVSEPTRPALAGVRFINALADTTSVDIRMVDQVDWSAVANNLAFRAGTEHQPTEAKARHIRAFAFLSSNPTIDNVSKQLLDTTITFTANSKVTLLLTGSARAKTVQLVMISDDAPSVGAGQIAVRAVNASTGAVDAYFVAAPADPITGTPAAANLTSNTASTYVTRATGNVALRVTDRGSTTANASVAGPTAPVGAAGTLPAAGVNTGGSAFSVYYFPRGVAGSPQNAVSTAGIVWFVDRVPTA